MSRIRIELPSSFHFTTRIPVRITDINYGGHMGNDSVLSLLHEARMQYLAQWGYSEMNFGGVSMIIADAGIEFKHEAFYGETIIASVTATNLSKVGFDLYYKLEKEVAGTLRLVVAAKTAMICYDYDKKKITPLPESVKEKLV